MLVFFYILVILIILVLILCFSYIKLEIDELKIDTSKDKKIENYKIKIYLVFLNKIKYLKITIDKEKIQKMKKTKFNKIKNKILNSKKLKKIKEKGLITNTNNLLQTLKRINIEIDKLRLNANFGMKNIVVLTYLIAMVDIVLSMVLSKKTLIDQKKVKHNDLAKKYSYTITPKQTKTIYIKLHFNAIFSIKISNIVKKTCNPKILKV